MFSVKQTVGNLKYVEKSLVVSDITQHSFWFLRKYNLKNLPRSLIFMHFDTDNAIPNYEQFSSALSSVFASYISSKIFRLVILYSSQKLC